MNDQPVERLTISIAETAQRLGICRQHAREVAEAIGFRLGARWLVPVELLEAYVRNGGRLP